MKIRSARYVISLMGVLVFILALLSSGESKKTEAKKDDPAKWKEFVDKGNQEYENENYQAAFEQFQQAIQAGNNDGIVLYKHAYSKTRIKQFDLNDYEKAYHLLIEQNPDHKYVGYAINVLLKNAARLDYRKAMFEEYEEGSLMVIEGEVFQAAEDDEFMLHTKKTQFLGYSEDLVYVAFKEPPKALEGDIIKIIANYDGTVEYKTIFGAKNKVPRMKAFYYEVVESGS